MRTLITGRARTALLTAFAMVAFAANSVLCRLALGGKAIDAAGFTAIRIGSGALTLALIAGASRRSSRRSGTWTSGLMLALYAVAFSFAYLNLSTGTGALILFGWVQLTMIMSAIRSGEHLHAIHWAGIVIAFSGLVYLVFPGVTAPSPEGAALMAAAGIAWGVYSARGRGATDPVSATSGNFLRAVPFAVVPALLFITQLHAAPRGILLAAVSGALTSGVGYVLWYAALKGLTSTRAAVVQLSVPVLAALGGVLLMAEPVSSRLAVSAIATLGGVGMTVFARERRAG